jgi:hypothetical protein
MNEVERFRCFYTSGDAAPRPVKVAIMDTGFRVCAKTWKMYRSRIKDTRSWLNQNAEIVAQPTGSDSDGHGTHCATAFLKSASSTSELYIGQVFGSRKRADGEYVETSGDPGLVAQVCESLSSDLFISTDVLL